jgi:hypothetical protein
VRGTIVICRKQLPCWRCKEWLTCRERHAHGSPPPLKPRYTILHDVRIVPLSPIRQMLAGSATIRFPTPRCTKVSASRGAHLGRELAAVQALVSQRAFYHLRTTRSLALAAARSILGADVFEAVWEEARAQVPEHTSACLPSAAAKTCYIIASRSSPR